MPPSSWYYLPLHGPFYNCFLPSPYTSFLSVICFLYICFFSSLVHISCTIGSSFYFLSLHCLLNTQSLSSMYIPPSTWYYHPVHRPFKNCLVPLHRLPSFIYFLLCVFFSSLLYIFHAQLQVVCISSLYTVLWILNFCQVHIPSTTSYYLPLHASMNTQSHTTLYIVPWKLNH